MAARGRSAAVVTLVVLSAVALLLAVVAGYVRRAAVDSDQFANRATVALEDDSVRSLIAEQVTDEIVLKAESNLIAARPIVESVVSSVVGSRAFTDVFRSAVRDVHRAVFDRDQNTVTLTVADVGTLVGAGLQVIRPQLARRIEDEADARLVTRDIGASGDVARAADTVRLLAWLLAVVAIVLAAGGLVFSTNRRRTMVQLGISTAVAGVVIVIGLAIGRDAVTDTVDTPEAQAAVGAIWDAFLGDLRSVGWIVAGSGAVVAAAAASLIRPVDIGAPLRRAGVWVTTEPTRPAFKVLRAALLIAAGLLLVLDTDAVVNAVFTLVGVYLIYAGVSAILWLIYRPAEAEVSRARVAVRGRQLIAVAVAAVVIVVAAGTFVATGGTSTAAPAADACNGHRELCDRPLTDVVLPATHNAMSVPLPGWFASEQDRPIPNQLDDGVRGLLIDTHYADRLADGRLRTVIDTEEARSHADRDGVSPDAVDAALRIRERLGFSGEGTRGMYLCHTFCELGGTRLDEVLDQLHDFLVANPGEVVVVINQDYVTPEDFVGAVADAGLDDVVYRGPTTGEWPTLGEMIETDQRLVFLAENHAGAAPWYHLAYEAITEETPYTFKRPALLTDRSQLAASCKPNRGPDNAPLFLINHWISTDPIPLPSHAQKVNAYKPLLRRARECQKIRDHLPNLLAVNFYRRGDVFGVVDTLNGVR